MIRDPFQRKINYFIAKTINFMHAVSCTSRRTCLPINENFNDVYITYMR